MSLKQAVGFKSVLTVYITIHITEWKQTLKERGGGGEQANPQLNCYIYIILCIACIIIKFTHIKYSNNPK